MEFFSFLIFWSKCFSFFFSMFIHSLLLLFKGSFLSRCNVLRKEKRWPGREFFLQFVFNTWQNWFQQRKIWIMIHKKHKATFTVKEINLSLKSEETAWINSKEIVPLQWRNGGIHNWDCASKLFMPRSF